MTYHVGIVGGGNISNTHARAAGETGGVQVAAVYGQNYERAERLAESCGAAAFKTLEALLHHRPLDLVLIGSPSGLHAEHGIAAANRGLHVLVEKPIDVTAARANALIAACDKAGVKLGVCFQDRVAPGLVGLKQLIDQGGLGKIILVSGRVKWYRPPDYYIDSRWRGTLSLDGGGALMNQGIHTVDLLLWLLGDLKRTFGRAVTALHKIESEDTVVATLEFLNGAVGTLEAATSAYPGYPRRVEITGTEGTVIIENDRVIAADLRTPPPPDLLAAGQNSNPSANSPIVSDVSGHKRILEDFLRAIERNGTPICDGREGRRSVELVEAIYESSRTGAPVGVS